MDVKIGDVFYTSWGYDQTNVEFFQVVGFTPSKKSVRLKEINKEYKETGYMSGVSFPQRDSFKDQNIKTKRLDIGSYEPSVRIDNVRYAWLLNKEREQMGLHTSSYA